ncbi:MAG: allophanate hydrolase [Parvibaculaceae bacterium]
MTLPGLLSNLSLDLVSLKTAYADGVRVEDVFSEIIRRINVYGDPAVWISRVDASELIARARLMDQMSREERGRLALFGVPFAVKDNIDVAGIATTAGCPAYAYVPKESAEVVKRLVAAGAVVLGKTNLDQFATGLVGTRSPYGAPRSVFNKDYISGGSSSGSAVAVAAGLASFALGTDTAGSGRVPAAFNNIIGLKPSKGLLSTRGVVPACRSLDCVSVFALSAEDAGAIFHQAAVFDAGDPYARALMPSDPIVAGAKFTFAAPCAADLVFFGDSEAERLFGEALRRLEELGGRARRIDFAPFREAAALLYEGPWVAERTAAVGRFIEENPKDVDRTVASIIAGGRTRTAVEVFEAFQRLQILSRNIAGLMSEIDVLVVPTAPTTYTVDEVKAEPLKLNARLGTYTNFMNLADLCGIAIPAGFTTKGLPFGVTLCASAFGEARLLELGSRFQAALGLRSGGPLLNKTTQADAFIELAVVGAHMSGLPLNHELTSRGATFVERLRTTAHYRFYALAGGPPFRPGLIRAENGAGIELEVWRLPRAAFGDFMAGVPSPLCIGTVELSSGRKVKGFLCEASGLEGASDITSFGGWRAYMADKAVPVPEKAASD